MKGKKYLSIAAVSLTLLTGVCTMSNANIKEDTKISISGYVAARGESSDTWKMIQEKGVMVVGLDESFPPMGFRDEKTNELIGFDIDMGAELGKRMGVEIQWQPTEWDGIMGELNSKKFDVIISGMSATDESKKAIDFSQNYVDGNVIVVKKNNTDITSAKDIKDKKIGKHIENTSRKACNVLWENYPEAFQDLATGEVDAMIVDATTADQFISKKPDTYKVAGEGFIDEPYAIGIRKADTDLKDAIDKALSEMKEDGTLNEIWNKWFGYNSTSGKIADKNTYWDHYIYPKLESGEVSNDISPRLKELLEKLNPPIAN